MLHSLAEPHRDLFERERSFIFLVSHMRSFSSLLGHLLAACDEVDGYSELHQSYRTELDLLRMAIDVRGTYDEPLAGTRLFDKLLHRRPVLEPAICNRSDVHVILAVRTPADTLASLIRLGSQDSSVSWAANPDRALLYYQRRIGDLAALASQIDSAAFMVANELVRDNAAIRSQLASFLDLPAIPATYPLHARTGHKQFGDTSANIISGTIQPAPSTADDAAIPPAVLEQANQAFSDLLADPALSQLTLIGDLSRYRV